VSTISTEDRAATPVSVRPRVRRAWRVLGTLVVGAMLLSGVYQVVVALAHEEYPLEPQQFDPARVATIEVHNGADGPVRVIGSDTDTITVTARVSDGLRRTGHSERVEGDRLVVDSSCPIFGSDFCSVDYVIETPPDVDVVVRTDTGAIRVSDIDGDVDVESDSSGIQLAGIRGSIQADSDSASVQGTELSSPSVDASSDSGGVLLEFDRAPRTVTADSDSSDVEVVLPDSDMTYRVETSTDSGSESMQVNTAVDSDRTITASSDSGDVTVRYRRG
jgi:Putative adhesin